MRGFNIRPDLKPFEGLSADRTDGCNNDPFERQGHALSGIVISGNLE